MTKEMEKAQRKFAQELAALEEEFGEKATRRALFVYAKATYWLRKFGYGKLELSAIGHLFGPKIRGDTFFPTDDDR